MALCWDTVASHGAPSHLVPAVGKEVTARRVFPKFKPVVPLPSPRPVAGMMVDRWHSRDGGVLREAPARCGSTAGLPSVVLRAGGWPGSAEPLL